MAAKRHKARGGSFYIYDAERYDSSEMVVISSDSYGMYPRQKRSLTVPIEEKVRCITCMHTSGWCIVHGVSVQGEESREWGIITMHGEMCAAVTCKLLRKSEIAVH